MLSVLFASTILATTANAEETNKEVSATQTVKEIKEQSSRFEEVSNEIEKVENLQETIADDKDTISLLTEELQTFTEQKSQKEEEVKTLDDKAKQLEEEVNSKREEVEKLKQEEEQKKQTSTTPKSSTTSNTSNSSSSTSSSHSHDHGTVTQSDLESYAGNNQYGTSENVAKVINLIKEKFGVQTIYGYANTDDGTGHGHNTGLSVDFMVDKATGDAIAKFLQDNFKELGVYYIIWEQKFYMEQQNIYGPAYSWGWMPDRGDATQNHYDHVHVSFNF